VLTSSYQAEYGRSSGLQVNAVTKSGTNRFRGSLYDVEQNSKWNANSETNILNGDPKNVTKQRDWGGAIGGPVGKPGGSNKLFFFYSHEYRPQTLAINSGNPIRIRVPTALERQGDFSQTLDNNGNLYNLIKDPLSTSPCTTANTAGCFQDGGVLGKIPANRLYQTGLNILNWWPKPNLPNTPGVAYNFTRTSRTSTSTGTSRSSSWTIRCARTFAAASSSRSISSRTMSFPARFRGGTTKEDNFGIWTTSYVGNWTVNPSTFVEASFGRNTHHQEGCSITGGAPELLRSGLASNPTDNRVQRRHGDLPLLFPDAGVMDTRYKSFTILNSVNPPFWDGTRATPVPSWAWGTRSQCPAQHQLAGVHPRHRGEHVQRERDQGVRGAHAEGGYAFLESVQRRGNANIQGTYTFANDANNPLDTTFGFANAAVGVFSSIAQTSRWTEGKHDAEQRVLRAGQLEAEAGTHARLRMRCCPAAGL
jgi:hypothetical protein